MDAEKIFPKENVISGLHLQALVGEWAERKVSGIIYGVAAGQQIMLLFSEGNFSLGYSMAPGQIKKIFGLENLQDISNEAATFTSLQIPVSGMTIARIMVEQEPSTSESVLRADLLAYLFGLQAGKLPVALELQGAQSCSWIAMPGGSLPVRDAVIVENGKTISEKDLLAITNQLVEPVYTVNIYPVIDTDAWLEYMLRYIFGFVGESLLSRYGELTGRVMVTSIVRDMNINSASMNLNIVALGQSIQDSTLFPSPVSAVEHYKFLFNLIVHHIETVVGSGLIVMIARQISGNLPDFLADIINRYNLLPDIFIIPTKAGNFR